MRWRRKQVGGTGDHQPVAAADASTFHLLGRLFSENFKQHAPGYALSFVFLAIVASTTALTAWFFEDVVNEIFIERNRGMVLPICLVIVALFTVKGLATYLQTITLSRVGNAIVASLQEKIFSHLLRQDIAFFSRRSSPELIARISTNAQAARAAIDLVVVSLGRDVLTFLGLVAVMFYRDPMLATIGVGLLPIAAIGIGRLTKLVKELAKLEFSSIIQLINHTQETAQGVRVVKAFQLEPQLGARMADAIDGLRKRSNRIAMLNGATVPLLDTLGGLSVALVVLYGGYSVIIAGNDPGAFFSFIMALLLASEPARRLGQLRVKLETHMIGVRLLYELLDTPTGEQDAPDSVPLAIRDGRIEFDKVRFKYDKAPVLGGLDLVIEGGKTTALVGPSGAGKSTVFNLLLRFYAPQSGQIRVDGQDIVRATRESVRRAIAYVGQDTFLFQGTIRDNIAMGASSATTEAIEAAARAANAHDFIMALPRGYDTQVGERGHLLSGGQRQRIAIARAILKDAPILLLDEATSSLDSEAERAVQDALTRLMEGRTTVVIAHRLSTVLHADQIFVIVGGRAVERGTHTELLGKGGAYARLYRTYLADPGDSAETTRAAASV